MLHLEVAKNVAEPQGRGDEDPQPWEVQGSRGRTGTTPTASQEMMPPPPSRPPKRAAAAMNRFDVFSEDEEEDGDAEEDEAWEAQASSDEEEVEMLVVVKAEPRDTIVVDGDGDGEAPVILEEEDEDGDGEASVTLEEEEMEEDLGTAALHTQEACVTSQLSPIDGDIAMEAEHAAAPPAAPLHAGDEEPAGLTLVDARNGFNELSRFAMLWTVRHLWPKGARYAINCYRHSAQLVLRTPAEKAVILLSREGVTQGDPLSMVLYGVALLPLAKALRARDRLVVQPWYADDAAMWGKARRNARVLRALVDLGPSYGYFPEPEKSWHVCAKEDEAAARQAFEEEGFPDIHYTEGYRYVGGYVGTLAKEVAWLRPKVEAWAAAVKTLARVALRYPQAAYAGLCMSLQAEWQYILRTVPGSGALMGPVENAITLLKKLPL